MQATKHIVIVAGEESGDMHAASFVRQLKISNPNLRLSGIGGRHMQAAGVHLISDLARFGVTGVSEVIQHIWVIKRAFTDIKTHLTNQKPDLLILVDYPGFNLRLAKFAKQVLGILILYYISPQIWAWKANRIKTIQRYVDRMAVILPFEKKLYEQAGVSASFVGHPLVDNLPHCANIDEMRQQLGLPENKRIIAMLPGSRGNEITRHMPVLYETAKRLLTQFEDLHFVIPIAGSVSPTEITSYFSKDSLPISFIQNKAVETMACSDCVIVASGTASLECALLEKPMCIIYKSSLLTYIAASKLIRVNYLGLCNLLKNEMIAPELLQYDCNPLELTRAVSELLTDNTLATRMTNRLRALKLSLSSQQADCTISQLIQDELACHN